MSQVMNCSFTIHIDELVALEVPMAIHKRWKRVMNLTKIRVNYGTR